MSRKRRAVGPRIYIGPALPMLPANTVFRGVLPGHVAALMTAQPEIGLLIVPIAQAAAAMQKISTPGTALHQAYSNMSRPSRPAEVKGQ